MASAFQAATTLGRTLARRERRLHVAAGEQFDAHHVVLPDGADHFSKGCLHDR